jgi:ribosomal protein S18 acetylase RimI-like enzyme
MKPVIIELKKPQIESLQTQIVTIYRDAFVLPPYNKSETEITSFADSFLSQLDRRAYKFVGAFAESNPGQLIGFSYGYSSVAGKWWREHVKPALPKPFDIEWPDDNFQIAEIAVSPQAQGQGVGGCLHDGLLSDLPYERAILATMDADTAAYRLYKSRGWLLLLNNFLFPDVDRRYQILGRYLSDANTG